MEIAFVSVLTLVVIGLLVSEKLPVDLTALGIIAVLMAAGTLTPGEALSGFANPAPITIAALLIVSRSLVRTGGLDWLADRLLSITNGKPLPLLILSLVLAGVFSAFINNTPVVVLFISMFLAVCNRNGLAPSKYLMPISHVSILAGTCTLIGTSTNIVVSDLGAQLGVAPIGMFELSTIGVPIALVGTLYLVLVSNKLLPEHRSPVCEVGGEKPRYISELLISPDSPLVGLKAAQAFAEKYPELEVFELFRAEAVFDPTHEAVDLQAGDVLLVKASVNDLVDVFDSKQAAFPDRDGLSATRPFEDGAMIVELIVPPGSEVTGLSVEAGVGLADTNLRVIGVRRGHSHFTGQKMCDRKLTTGDIILVQCSSECLQNLGARGELIVMEDVHHQIRVRRRAPLAVLAFLIMIGLAASGLVDIVVASVSAAFLLILTGCVSLRGAYRSLDVKVLLLLIGTITLGLALRKTGAADLYAVWFLKLFAGASPHWVLAGFVLATSALSHFLSNTSTAVLLLPVALATAESLGVDARPFLIGICFGASACYATPIGYQTNLLVYAPGGYRFMDFVKLGLPLSLMVCVASAALIPIFWPF